MGEKLRYSLRTLFVITTTCAVLLALVAGGVAVINREWIKPAKVGAVAQARLDAIFAKRGWSGNAATFHYDQRVRIDSPDVGDAELKELYPPLRDIGWLRHIELFNTHVSAAGVADLQSQFPTCHVSQNR